MSTNSHTKRSFYWTLLAAIILISCNLSNRLPLASSATPSLEPSFQETRATVALPTIEIVFSTEVNPPTETPTVTLPGSSTLTSVPSPLPATLPPPSGGSGQLYAVVGVAPGDVLNVRYGPGVGNPILGEIPPYGMGVELIGATQQTADGASWVPVRYQAVQGWANRRFLAEQRGEAEPELARRANEAIQALKQKDLLALSQLVHPQEGLRFSPYGYIRDEDLRFEAQQVAGLLADPKLYTWGAFDGSGEPIYMSFADYYNRFVYDVEFASPAMIGFNQVIGQGNTINNLGEVYPGASFVEYHFPGFDPQYGGMDWRSLRLVFERSGGSWFLVGVIHDEWTI